MHPELSTAYDRRETTIKQMNDTGTHTLADLSELQDLEKRIALMEAEPRPDPDQPSLELDVEPKPKRAAKF